MKCARGDCGRRADLIVDFGAGLLVLLCYQDGVRALVAEPGRRIVRQLTAATMRDDPPERGVTG